MLTRSGVAKRIGKSLATVRRLEGYGLSPQVDGRGIHRFGERQVQALVELLAKGERVASAQGRWLRGQNPPRVQRNPPAVIAPSEPPPESVESITCRAKQEVAVTILELCGEWQLRRLGPDVIEYLEELLGDSAE